MTYATNIEKSAVESAHLLVINFSIPITDQTTLTSESVEKSDSNFTTLYYYTYPEGLRIDSIQKSFSFLGTPSPYTEKTSLVEIADNQGTSDDFYYDDKANRRIYFTTPDTTLREGRYMTFEAYLSDRDITFHYDPTDSATDEVWFRPYLKSIPDIADTSEDFLFGFKPAISGTISASNTDPYWEVLISDANLRGSTFFLYHVLGELVTANVKLISKGEIGFSYQYNDKEVQIGVFDRLSVLSKFYKPWSYLSEISDELDPAFETGTPNREIYGVVDRVRGVNVSYVAADPTTSDNRYWRFFGTKQDNTVTENERISTTGLDAAHTATRLYVADNTGFNPGDRFLHPWSSAPTTRNCEITATGSDGTGDYFDHNDIGDVPPTDQTLATITRFEISAVDIIQNGKVYKCVPGSDYTSNKAGYINFASVESNLGMDTLTGNELVFARVYGDYPKSDFTINGTSAHRFNTTKGYWDNAAAMIYWILVNKAGISTDDIDLDAFETYAASTATGYLSVGMATLYEQDNGGNLMTTLQIINELAKSDFLRIYINEENKISITRIGPLGNATYTVKDDEIMPGSFVYDFDQKDVISKAVIGYNKKMISESYQEGEYYNTVSATNNVGGAIGATISRQFNTVIADATDAQTYANRMRYVFATRQGVLRLKTKQRAFNLDFGDIVEVERERMPGKTVTVGTNQPKKFAIQSIKRGEDYIELELNDQQGIEDNGSDW